MVRVDSLSADSDGWWTALFTALPAARPPPHRAPPTALPCAFSRPAPAADLHYRHAYSMYGRNLVIDSRAHMVRGFDRVRHIAYRVFVRNYVAGY